MRTESKMPSQDEARVFVERARALRAETLARMLRAGWARIAPNPEAPAGRSAGAMPQARA